MALRTTGREYQMRGNVQTTPPAAEPVTAAELRTLLRETATGLPDAEADDFIAEARQYIEQMTGIAMITQSWTLTLDCWPKTGIPFFEGVHQGSVNDLYASGRNARLDLPTYPLQSITSVKTYDEDGTETAITVANVFDVDTYQKPGRIGLKVGASWPTALRGTNAIIIVYVAGYGDAASDVPAPLVAAVKRLAGYLYSHRGDGCDPDDAFVRSGAASMVKAYKVWRV